ncbi:hypothetical protein Arub01_25580 [Actinomadura rubrobrunea]|uniref:HNH nuclease domain-containing protein n=1 Tax=Actinomadura rubrobrunea TaxID=115335 RepID=A0A9W6PWF7_9ACTN|nr:HNH endonuclease signature motif containing protein [Actinomadura rubrobrunea]GLW64314.1 hypothetical protein Arub01_25580 [Actinomadura rubrobrunea]
MNPTHHERLLNAVKNLKVAGTPDGPARHQPLTLLWAMGRVAHHRPRLVAWRDCHAELRALFREYGQPSSRPRPEFPWLALYRTDLWELHGHTGNVPTASGEPIKWMERHNPYGGLTAWAYELVDTSEESRAAVIDEIGHRFFNGTCPEQLLKDVGLLATASPVRQPAQPPSPVEEYLRLVQLVEAAEARGDHNRTTTSTREQPVRSDAARKAVLIRSRGRCENPLCTGQPNDVTDGGDPILEVDHIDDRAGWGRDHPENMIALCPNCHAIKTRGRSRDRLRPLLRTEAQARHEALRTQRRVNV